MKNNLLYKALASNSRFAIVCSLINREKSVGQLAKETGQSDSATSHALGFLKKVGIVELKRKQKNTHFYGLTLRDPVWNVLRINKKS